jgi:anaerobic magnesium-protoporphyrin IX monomethyl ester cyclase
MENFRIAFIGPDEYNNLGIGYISASLPVEGFETDLINFEDSDSDIFNNLSIFQPDIIGFSVIFQYCLERFIFLAGYLREMGFNCHFTAGGHYASLKTDELFDFIPQLDSIVRFEGEYTFHELACRIQAKTEWRNVAGLAYRENGRTIFTKLRPIEEDLDKFPFPKRTKLRKFAFELPVATIIAGRGCAGNCIFCNVRKYYHSSGGPLKRIRNPEFVVKEMLNLYENQNCPIFLFLDDDFPVRTNPACDWVTRFCNELQRVRLSRNILWKICCRPDEVEEEKFRLMRENGLFLVFLGIEDGTAEGLKYLKKNTTVDDVMNSVRILKKLDIGIDYGFLLFHPESTFCSIRENLNFLGEICNDGYMPVTFLKAMPYYDTQMEKDLIAENRLKMRTGIRDYAFKNPEIDRYYDFITLCFSNWLRNSMGIHNQLCWIRNYFLVYFRFFGNHSSVLTLHEEFKEIVSFSNKFLIETMLELLGLFENELPSEKLEDYRSIVRQKNSAILKILTSISNRLYMEALNHAFSKLLGAENVLR